MPGSLHVRAATPADVAAIAAIFAPYVTDSVLTFETVPPTQSQWLAKLAAARNAGNPFLVAAVDSAVVGYACVTPWKIKPAYAHTWRTRSTWHRSMPAAATGARCSRNN